MFDLAAPYSKGVKSVSLRVFFPTWRWGELFRSLNVALRQPMERVVRGPHGIRLPLRRWLRANVKEVFLLHADSPHPSGYFDCPSDISILIRENRRNSA